MSELFASISTLVNQALSFAAGAVDSAGNAAGAAVDAASLATDVAAKMYELFLAVGMTPEQSADATEIILRQVTEKWDEVL